VFSVNKLSCTGKIAYKIGPKHIRGPWTFVIMIDPFLIVKIFVLLNPFSSFPFLINAQKKKMNVTRVAIKAVLAAFAVALVIALVGPSLFSVFGISLDAFRIAGGIVLLLLSISMIRPHEEDRKMSATSLITIIATPMLTGPATISFITLSSFEIGLAPVLANLCLAFVAVGAVFIVFSMAVKKINPSAVDMVSRVSGLFLAAVAIEMIAKGIDGMVLSYIA
jgi:multiple antibiotic resistance protein